MTDQRLYRRIRMTTAAVTISSTDDSGPVHKVQGKVRGTPETIDNLQTLNLFGFASHAPIGSDALVIFGNGDRSNGAIVATANQKARPRGQKSGEVTIFTDDGTTICLQRDGNIVITSAAKIRLVTPRLEVTGEIVAHCDGAAVAVTTHTHGRVQTGGGHTDKPDAPS